MSDKMIISETACAPVRFVGLDFQAMPTEQAVRALADAARADAAFSYVVTPNVDHRVRLAREASLQPLYDAAGLILNDSRILEALASRDGLELPASPGADVVEGLLTSEIDRDEPVGVIGCGRDEIDALKARFGLSDVRWYDAPMGLAKNPEAVAACADFMAANPARFHFICVGSPQQEMVALAAKRRGDVKGVGLCCGASLEFLTGKVARAPEWMRKSRLEWLHRLGSEPRRLAKRYIIDGPAILKIWRQTRKENR
jgi:exopolysaccharide biosynthesis WecB/TagA/CpsF family protein